MQNWKAVAGLVGLVLAVLVGIGVWGVMQMRGAANRPGGGTIQQTTPTSVAMTTIDLASAPADVQEAAQILRTSRVGYAMAKPDRTYVIISTGSESSKVVLNRVIPQPMGTGVPSLLDVFLDSSSSGSSLIVAAVPLSGGVEYQFDVDGQVAAIPTLHNPDSLPLVALSEAQRFALVSPAADQVVSSFPLRVAGYARVFEAQFTLKLLDGKGRELGRASGMAAAGAPDWGSFVAEIRPDVSYLPDRGFLVLEEGESGATLTIPVRFSASASPQLG